MSNVIEYSIKALDNFSAVMDKLHGNLSKTEKAFAALGITAAFYASVRTVTASLDNAEAMGAAAEKANMATAQFSALAWAAKMSNVEQGSLTTGLKMLGKALAEGDATPAGKSLQTLGVAAQDATGKVRPTIDVLMDVADRFKNAAQDANKTKVAMELFGRSGVEMVPMLNQGGAAIRGMMADAQKLGIVITDEFAKSADQVNDNLETMSAVLKGSVNVAMSQLSPVLEEATGQLIEFATEGDNIQQVGQVIATAMRLIMSSVAIVVGTVKTLGDALGGIFAALAAAAQGQFTEAFNIMQNTVMDVGSNIVGTLDRVNGIWDENAQSAAANAAKQMSAAMKLKESLQVVNKEADEAIKRDIEFSNNTHKMVADMQLAVATYGMTADQIKIYTLAVQGADSALVAEALNAANATSAQEAHTAALERAQGIITSLQTPLDLHNQKLKEIHDSKAMLSDGQFDAALEAENVRWENARAAVEWYGVSVASVAQGIGNAMAQTVVDGMSLARGLENVAKSVLRTVIATLVQIGVQRMVLAMIDRTATATGASQKLAAGLSEVFVNSFASAAAIPMVGWAIAPQVATANTAIAAAGAATSMATGAGLGASVGGIAHGGLDYVPAESTFLLDKGERVLSPRQNEDLTAFLNEGGGGGVMIENVTIHVLENATNVDAFARMDKIQLRNALGQPIIDALNEMFLLGQRPNFATQNR